LLLCCWHLAF